MTGNIYLIPVTLGGEDYLSLIPEKVLTLTKQLRYFIVEDIRSARRFLRLIDREFPIDDTNFIELNEHTNDSDLLNYLDPVQKGNNIGIMSEAGLPGIADPGSKIILLAHQQNIRVIPLSGPSSIILALVSSGLNGQNFSFNGYLPVNPFEKKVKIRDLENRAREGYSQIFMETPYRNQKMFEALISTCKNDTMLCIAADITLPSESIKTMNISEWKNNIPSLKGKLVIYVLQ